MLLSDMNYEALRELFESLCDYLEEDAPSTLSFRAGLGFESPHDVVMVFFFDTLQGPPQRMAVVCRFVIERQPVARATVPMTSDECLGLIEKVRSLEDTFQALFVAH